MEREAKRALRARLRAGRRERPLDPVAEQAVGARIAERVLNLPEVRRARCVAAYVDRSGEPPTGALLAGLAAAGREVLLPVVLPDLDLDWAVDDGSRAAGHGPGVDEPTGARLGPEAVARADVVVAPALAVDVHGRRLGQGGGSYDRALARVPDDVLVVALVHDDEVLDAVPVEPHDRRVDVVVTATRVLRPTSPPVSPPEPS